MWAASKNLLAKSTNKKYLSFAYDYFIKDHLGNVRMALTDEQRVDEYPAATMEVAQTTTEEQLYGNMNTRDDKPAGYPTDNTTTPNDKVAKTSGGGNKIGPSIILKVMAGDKFSVKVSSWYKTYGFSPNSPADPLADLLSSLINGVSGVSVAAGHGVTTTDLQNSGVLTPGASSFLTNQTNTTNSSKPQAYVNWIFFDEQFNMVTGSSGFEQVGNNEEFKQHVKTDLPISKNGYLHVYVSNSTPNIYVFFDNLQVTHTRGAILEETHYYPFGLTMAGISSKVVGGIENKKKYNAKEEERKEFSDGSGLELYSTFYRSLDPQLGRFWQIDPKPSYDESLYTSMGNNPILHIDFLGDSPTHPILKAAGNWLKGQTILGLLSNTYENIKAASNGNKLAIGSFISSTTTTTLQGVTVFKNGTTDQKLEFGTGLFLDVLTATLAPKAFSTLGPVAPETNLYRAVSSEELIDATTNGVRVKTGGYETSKLFAATPNDAAQFGKNNFMLDGIPNTIVKVPIPNSVLKASTIFEADGMKAVAVPAEQLKSLGRVKPLNSSPISINPFSNVKW